MTIEEKAKAYDDVIRKAKITLGCCNSASIETKHTIYDIFPELNPELEEDEDKRIRKELKHYLDVRKCLTTDDEEYIACNHFIDWLEKQNQSDKSLYIRFGDIPINGKSKVYNGEIETGIEEGISVYPAFEDKEGNIVLGLNLPITKTSLHTQQHLLEYDSRPCYLVTGDYVGKGTDGEPLIKNVKIIKEIKHYRMKQDKENNTYTINITPNCGIQFITGELKVSDDDAIALLEKQGEKDSQIALPIFTFDDVLALQCCMETVKKVQKDKDLYKKLNDLHSRVYDAYHLEKQGEQKIANKVKPKFKVGDWVVSNNYGEVWQIGARYTEEGQSIYLCNVDEEIMSITLDELNNDYHLWTINDAKDGDVLAIVDNKYPFIYKGCLDPNYPNSPVAYCGIDSEGDFTCVCIKELNYWWTNKEVQPATKEQRDLLFQKMKQAGYEWDAENKKLSKQTLKITPKFCVGQVITDNNGNWYKITNIKCLDNWHYELYDVGKASTHFELCSIIDEKFRENRFVNEIGKMMGD